MTTENPIQRFARVYEEALRVQPKDANAMVLASVGADGRPSTRVVLLKDFDERGFVFYTNLQSRKGRELIARPAASLCFYWPALEQQVRIDGTAEKVPDAEADAYFATRPRLSQVGAWASDQSRPLASREELEERVRHFEEKFTGPVPRPPHWSGFRVAPTELEFWIGKPNRLHDRTLYVRTAAGWESRLLYP